MYLCPSRRRTLHRAVAASTAAAALASGVVLVANPAIAGSSDASAEGGRLVVRRGDAVSRSTAGRQPLRAVLAGSDKATAESSDKPGRTGAATVKSTSKATAKAPDRAALAPVAGIPSPCPARHPWPEDASPEQRKAALQRWAGIQLQGPGWTNASQQRQAKLVWQTLDALSCTDYLATVKSSTKGFGLYAGPTRSWAWGDWGLTHPDLVTLDFAKFAEAIDAGDPGRVVRIIVHEIGHAWSQAPSSQKAYDAFAPLYWSRGNFGPYAYNHNENFSEVIGYYVARCAKDNPYDGNRHGAYYEFVRREVFGGREFGPAAGRRPSC